jgi:hypothetical protein
MSALMIASVALACLNTLLALVLGIIYWRNHRSIRSPFTLGLLLFAGFLLLFNATIVYHFVSMMPLFDAVSETLIFIESLLQTGALTALLYATFR